MKADIRNKIYVKLLYHVIAKLWMKHEEFQCCTQILSIDCSHKKNCKSSQTRIIIGMKPSWKLKKKVKEEDIEGIYENIIQKFSFESNSIKTAFYVIVKSLSEEYNEQWKASDELMIAYVFCSHVINSKCIRIITFIMLILVQNLTCLNLREKIS